jgi:hypothetical protein
LRSIKGECPDIGDDDPQAVKLMIDYLYLEDYDPSTTTPASGSSTPTEGKYGCDNDGHTSEVGQKDGSYQAHSIEQSWERQAAAPTSPLVGSALPVEDGWNLDRKKTKKDVQKRNKWSMAPPEPGPEPEAEPPLLVGTPARGDASPSFMEMHAKVFAIASKYDIKPLERIARQKLKAQTKCNWNITDLAAAMAIVFGQTPESELKLRRILKDLIVERASTLVHDPGFEDAVARIDGLAYDLFRQKMSTVA